MPATLTMTGLTELLREFGGFTPALTRELRVAQASARRLLVTELRHYPPPPPRSTYQRTGNLGRGWERADAAPVTNDARLIIENAVSYAEDVQGAQQAAVHRGRWATVDDVQAKHEAAVQALYADAAQRVVETIARR